MLYMRRGRKSDAPSGLHRLSAGPDFRWGQAFTGAGVEKIGSCWGSTKMNLYMSVKPCESRFPSSASVAHEPKIPHLAGKGAKAMNSDFQMDRRLAGRYA
jgi:hypothetical protein